MIRNCLNYFRFKIWAPWHANHYHSFYTSHSQFGEDMVLRHIFADKKMGFYVDIGAHHPLFISNTYHFYLKGWRGLCVDASAEAITDFKTIRPRDISVVACLSATSGTSITFYRFDQPALNTIDSEEAERIVSSGRAKLLEKTSAKTLTLSEILSKHLPKDVEVDFITIDIEGIDEELILGQDWTVFRPRAIAFESAASDWHAIGNTASVRHLEGAGYKIEAKCGRSVILSRSI